jgi:tetratricopeptide (TPR) repeat protein
LKSHKDFVNQDVMKNYFKLAVISLTLALPVMMKGSDISDTALVNRQIRSGFKYLSAKGNPEETKSCIDSAFNLCKRHELDIPALLNLLSAEYYFVVADYRNALDFARKSMDASEAEGNDLVKTRTLLFLGKFCFRTGSFQESISYFEQGIESAKKGGFKGLIPKALDGQSQVFRALGDLDSHTAYLKKMIEASYIEKDTSSISRGLYLLGTLYSEKLRNFRLCDSLLRECYAISNLRGDATHMSLAQANMGWNFYLAKMYDSAIVCYNRSLSYSVPANNLSAASNAYGNLGNIYRDINNTARSLDYYNKSVEMANKVNDLYNLQWVYLDISNLYLKMGDTSKAFNSFVRHKKFSDQYLIKNNTQGLTDAQLRYETDSHRKEVELLSVKLKNQRLIMLGYTGLTIFALALFLLLYRGSKLRSTKRISEMNRTISELTQANLRQQMNPHFIFNTLNSIQYYMYQHDKLATNNYLTKFTSLMRKVLENSQHTSVTIKDELEALNLYLELESLRFKERFDYRITIDEEIDPLLFKIPTMLIQPYVENSICHGLMPGEGKGLLKIAMKLEKDHISCIIEDNGIGREEAQKRKKTENGNHNSLGTRIVTSRLDLVNSLYGTSLKTIYTDLKNESGEPAGTKVEIHIPIIS